MVSWNRGKNAMNTKEIIARIEHLEELAILTHGTLDVDQIKTKNKAWSEKLKKAHKKLSDSMQELEEMTKIRTIEHEKWKKDMADKDLELQRLIKESKQAIL